MFERSKRGPAQAANSSYTMRGPWEKNRATYFILRTFTPPGEKRRSEQVVRPEIIELNRLHATGKLPIEAGRKRLEAIAEILRAEDDKAKLDGFHADNLAIAEKFIRDKVGAKVDILPGSRRAEGNGVWAFMRLFGATRFATASLNEIQRRLNAIEKEGSFLHHFKTAKALLRFIGRYKDADDLRPKRFPRAQPVYMSMEELGRVIREIPATDLEAYPMLPQFVRIVASLGVRAGEAIALEWEDLVRDGEVLTVEVSRQYAPPNLTDQSGRRMRPTKNRTVRPVIPLNPEQFVEDFRAWLERHPDVEDRNRYRYKASKVLNEIGNRIFRPEAGKPGERKVDFSRIREKKETRKFKGLHMLRAGHAVKVIELTGSEVYAANQIGDSPAVMRDHYAGVINSDKARQAFARLMAQAQKEKSPGE